MKLRFRQFVTSLILISLLTFGLTVNSAPTQDPNIPAAQANALKTLSEYMVGRYDTAGKLLKKYEYSPPPAIAQSWESYPAIKKLEYAYLAAETATPGAGGDKLLALLSQDLARQYESVRKNQALTKYVDADVATEPPSFRNPSPLPQRINLDTRVSAAIDSVADYCVKGPLGTPRDVLKNYFGLPESDAYQLLSQSESHSEAFRRAMDRMPREQQMSTLKRLTNDLKPHYEGLPYERSLQTLKLVDPPPPVSLKPPPLPAPMRRPATASQTYRPPAYRPPPPPEIANLPNLMRSARPTVPQRSVSTPSAQARYRSFMNTNYRSAVSRAFRSMASSFRGFGGVVFGSEVKSEIGSSKLFSIFIEETDKPGTVTVWCHFADGPMAGLPNVRAGDAYAAAEIYYPSKNSLGPRTGEGIGLVGVEDSVPYVDCDNTKLPLKRGKQFNVVMHPALEDLDLGWSALVVDTAPIEPEALAQKARLGKQPTADHAAEAIERLFKSLVSQTEVSLGTWKVVDVPMTISREGNVLSVRRTVSSESDFPEGLLQSSFLEMRNMTVNQTQAMFMEFLGEEAISTNQYDADFANEFYRLLPVLTTVSSDYERMNRFAPVLALFRWARKNGARLAMRPNRPVNTDTPDAVLVSGGQLTAISPYKKLDAFKQSQRNVTTCFENAQRSPMVAEYQKAAQPIYEELQRPLLIYRSVEEGSKEANEAREELKKGAEKLKALRADKPEVSAWLELRRMSTLLAYGIAQLEAEARTRPRSQRRTSSR